MSKESSETHQEILKDASAVSTPQNAVPLASFRRLKNKRFVYVFDDKAVYEWTQSLDECIMYIPAPPAPISVTIGPNHLTIGLKNGTSAFIDEDTCHTVDIKESTWTVEDGMIVVYLQKANKAVVWEGLLQGRNFVRDTVVCNTAARLDPVQLLEVQKEIMLERWGEQYPGMDFADAEFNGAVPDPRTFMGGVEYK
jgi:hypothetical protein